MMTKAETEELERLRRMGSWINWKGLSREACLIIVALIAAWISHGRFLITRVEAATLMEKQAPYVRDRSLILDSVNRLHVEIKELRQELREIRTEMKP